MVGYKGYIFDEVNKAWLAGVLDSEGCISIRGVTSKGSWRVEISNINKEFINKVLNLTRCGSINKSKGTNHIVYTWEVVRKSDIHYILKYILPYLIVKRKKAIDCIKSIEREKHTLLTCPKCNYTWRYFGRATFPVCPECKHHGTFLGMNNRNLIYNNPKSSLREISK